MEMKKHCSSSRIRHGTTTRSKQLACLSATRVKTIQDYTGGFIGDHKRHIHRVPYLEEYTISEPTDFAQEHVQGVQAVQKVVTCRKSKMVCGRRVSTRSTSLVARLRMRPRGLESKNRMGALKMRTSILLTATYHKDRGNICGQSMSHEYRETTGPSVYDITTNEYGLALRHLFSLSRLVSLLTCHVGPARPGGGDCR